MPCFHPIDGYRSRTLNPSGKRGIVFSKQKGYLDMPVTIPCGQCIGCRLERSRQWAMRCVHESNLHIDNCFLTLTYDNDHLPSGNTLVKKHFQDFMKRLRKKFPQKMRYFHCGEYGDQLSRPHYHALIFGLDFSDKEIYSERNGLKLYTSKSLQLIWPYGFCTIGNVTFESAAYVARYVMKKINGPLGQITGDGCPGHYSHIDLETGEITSKLPEYITMSLKPAIGKNWFNKYSTDVFPSDEVILRGMKLKPPKYYEKLYELHNHASLEKIKGDRVKEGKKHKTDQTYERLADREKCKLAQIKTLLRTLT